MSLAWVQAIVALFVSMMVSLTGLLTATAVLLPVHTKKAERALERTTTKCLFGGIGLLFVFFIGIAMLPSPFPLAKLMGFLIITGIASLLALGGAGMAQLMGNRISEMSGAKTTFGALLRGSIAYSVGVFFPFIGWFVLAPLSILCALGAGVSAIWPTPSSNPRTLPMPWPQQQPAYAGGPMMSMSTNVAMQPVQETAQLPYQAPYNASNVNSNINNSVNSNFNSPMPQGTPSVTPSSDERR